MPYQLCYLNNYNIFLRESSRKLYSKTHIAYGFGQLMLLLPQPATSLPRSAAQHQHPDGLTLHAYCTPPTVLCQQTIVIVFVISCISVV